MSINRRLLLEVFDTLHQKFYYVQQCTMYSKDIYFLVREISHAHIYRENSSELILTLGNFVWLS